MKKLLIVFLCLTALFSFSVTSAHSAPETVFVGGTPIGIQMETAGATITDIIDIELANGTKISPARIAGLIVGDIILSIDNKPVKNLNDLKLAILTAKDTNISIKIKRNGEDRELSITPFYDKAVGSKKIGVVIKNDLSGVGTLTFVKLRSMRFGGLGHSITGKETSVDLKGGNLFRCNIIGVIKGEVGKAGELRGIFNRSDDTIGKIEVNNFAGIYGKATKSLCEGRPLVQVAGRTEIQPGKAHIFTTINGNSPEKYEIEIVKVQNQKTPQEKSMVIRVTDKTLLEKTGGIVQGMSGSPIIQNEKLIGAVTHVFVNDPTRGYAIFADWMMKQ